MDAPTAMLTLPAWLDLVGIAVFALSGALLATRLRMTMVTVIFFALVTGVGGGSVRDLLIGAPVFWIEQPAYLVVCLAAGISIWAFGFGRFRMRLLLWLDALGMAAYSVVGAAKAGAFDVSPLPAIVMGVLTATCGGIIRDVVAEEPSVLLRREIYITAALLGATVFVGLRLIGVEALPAGLAGFSAALALRACAIQFKWSLPAFRGKVES